jgi:hypothetical protein
MMTPNPTFERDAPQSGAPLIVNVSSLSPPPRSDIKV